jgi:hypothetical protein
MSMTKVREIKIERVGRISIAHFHADYWEAHDFAKVEGGSLLTQQRALHIISTDARALSHLKGKRFWLSGGGVNREDDKYTFDKAGELAKITRNPTGEETVKVSNGTHPPHLKVYGDTFMVRNRWRFMLGGDIEPDCCFDVVVYEATHHKPAHASTIIDGASAPQMLNILRLAELNADPTTRSLIRKIRLGP